MDCSAAHPIPRQTGKRNLQLATTRAYLSLDAHRGRGRLNADNGFAHRSNTPKRFGGELSYSSRRAKEAARDHVPEVD